MFISPQNHVLPRAFSLTESCSNNVAEYNALLIGLQLAHGMGVRYLEAYGDSKLIINQVKDEYEVRHEDLVPYYHTVIELVNLFEGFYIGHVSRSQNTKADACCISNNTSPASRHRVSPHSGNSTPCML